jgi:hypothetical protein
MPNLTGPVQGFAQPTSLGSTRALATLGQRGFDANGNVFVYLQAGQALNPGEWVVYTDSYVATALTTSARGPVAIVQAAMTSDDYFWGQVEGVCSTAVGTSGVTSAGYLVAPASTTDGYVGEGTSSQGAVVYGAISRAAASTATTPAIGQALLTVQLMRPYVLGIASDIGSS